MTKVREPVKLLLEDVLALENFGTRAPRALERLGITLVHWHPPQASAAQEAPAQARRILDQAAATLRSG